MTWLVFLHFFRLEQFRGSYWSGSEIRNFYTITALLQHCDSHAALCGAVVLASFQATYHDVLVHVVVDLHVHVDSSCRHAIGTTCTYVFVAGAHSWSWQKVLVLLQLSVQLTDLQPTTTTFGPRIKISSPPHPAVLGWTWQSLLLRKLTYLLPTWKWWEEGHWLEHDEVERSWPAAGERPLKNRFQQGIVEMCGLLVASA